MFRAGLLLIVTRYYSVYTAVDICHAFIACFLYNIAALVLSSFSLILELVYLLCLLGTDKTNINS